MPSRDKRGTRLRQRRPRGPRPSFDVDESVAAAVLARVESPRDRLALACVSRVWRRVAATPGAWGTCDLVLDGELGENVTDERFERLMLYCGDVKHLEVRNAWMDFTGPRVSLAAKFASLTTVVLTGCESVDGASIVELMKEIGMTTRRKKDRLRRLHLAGCMVYDTDLRTLSACVFLGRLENFVACKKSPDEPHDGIDLWACRICGDVMPIWKAAMCVSCLDAFCVDCLNYDFDAHEAEGSRWCDGCEAFACHKPICGEALHWLDCDECHKTFCHECASEWRIHVCWGSDADDGCLRAVCEDCHDKPPGLIFFYCEGCDGRWCGECWNDVADGNLMCDDGDCDAEMCRACADASEHEFFCCHDGCGKTWCSECDPDVEPALCMFCAGMWCEECDPGVRSVEDTLVDGVPAKYSGDECCPTCEVTEFIFS